MTNSVKGEVTLNREGKEPFTLAMTFNALVSLEDDLNLPINEIANNLGDTAKFRLGLLRKVFHSALKEHHPDMSEENVGKLIQEIGITTAVAKMQEAFAAAFPKQGGAQQQKKK